MAYVSSNKIKVFPSTRRGADYRSSRLLAEQGLVSIINQLVDYPAFVITSAYSDAEGTLEFNIGGYYFCVDVQEVKTKIGGEPNEIWAKITLDTTVISGDNFVELFGQDEQSGNDTIFTGVDFTSSDPGADVKLKLKLLEKDSGGNYAIPVKSQLRFNADQVFSDLTVDGGVIS